MPHHKETKKRAIPQSPNNIAVVTWISVGDVSVLLGADLEEIAEDGLGWSVIFLSHERPRGKASIFKIPHHGSETAHNERVWDELLLNNPYAILTPFNRGHKKIPTIGDIDRINSHTEKAYSTSSFSGSSIKIGRPYAVVKTIRETVGKVRTLSQSTGWVRIRSEGNDIPNSWKLDLSENACHINQLKN